eukprot:scaffold2224_cov154-Amphora_coffeaeformis.AAC.5
MGVSNGEFASRRSLCPPKKKGRDFAFCADSDAGNEFFGEERVRSPHPVAIMVTSSSKKGHLMVALISTIVTGI